MLDEVAGVVVSLILSFTAASIFFMSSYNIIQTIAHVDSVFGRSLVRFACDSSALVLSLIVLRIHTKSQFLLLDRKTRVVCWAFAIAGSVTMYYSVTAYFAIGFMREKHPAFGYFRMLDLSHVVLVFGFTVFFFSFITMGILYFKYFISNIIAVPK